MPPPNPVSGFTSCGKKGAKLPKKAGGAGAGIEATGAAAAAASGGSKREFSTAECLRLREAKSSGLQSTRHGCLLGFPITFVAPL